MQLSRKAIALTMGILVVSLAGCASSGAPTNDQNTESALSELAITHVTSPLNVPSIIQKDKNMFAEEFKKNGKDLTVTYAEITSGADQTQALASGDIDVLYAVGGTSVVLAAANDADIKVLNMYSRSPEAFSLYSKDTAMTSAEALRGKTIAGPVGTNLHQLLVAYLKESNMTLEDVNYVNMSIPDAKAALDGGSIDAALLAGPTAYQAKEQGYHMVTDGKGLTDAIIAVAVREDFYNAHKADLNLLVEAQEHLIDYIDAHHDEVMQTVASELDLELDAVEEMFAQYDFDTEITEDDRKAFQNIADFMYETEMIEEKIDTKELFLDSANEQ